MIIAIILLVSSVMTYFTSIRSVNSSYRRILVLYALITIISAIAVRYFQELYPQDLLSGAVLKFCASLPSVLYAYRGYQLRHTKFGLIITLAIVLGLIADVSINISFLAGGAVFLIGHLLYDFAFFSEQRPSGKQVVLWLVLTVLAAAAIYLFRNHFDSFLNAAGPFLYISILISTVVFSWSHGKMIFAAALIFALSDCFMVGNMLFNSTILLKILALLVYYGALLVYGTVLWQRSTQ